LVLTALCEIRCSGRPTELLITSSPSNMMWEMAQDQNRSVLSECKCWCFAGGQWGLSGWPFWSHWPVCCHTKPVTIMAKSIQLTCSIGGGHAFKSHYGEKHFILKNYFSLLPVIILDMFSFMGPKCI
jgi:hypothetical protein